MKANAIKVKILDIRGSHVSFRYTASNAKSRTSMDSFKRDYDRGILDVQNPGLLDDK